MTLITGSIMMLVMLAFMSSSYRNCAANLGIILGAVILFVSAMWLVRSQVTVRGIDHMEVMIPHHSIAILGSKCAKIKDPHVYEFA